MPGSITRTVAASPPRAAGLHEPQQKHRAAAVPDGRHAHAAGSATQAGIRNITVDNAITKTGPAGMTFAVDGDSSGISAPHGDACLDTWNALFHPGGSTTGYRDLDSRLHGNQERPDNRGAIRPARESARTLSCRE